ncbi:hypothetical protein AaE_008484 [Aphanomyces astaci]|uniref:Uncharacterized protein n=1 Tax=Aphanomyces astaci TaxID=112090 RepID=A0A6A5A7M0_APHAT|nr:hypothetical protein AaE_008484 [Aphanomyces astaci]
MGGQVNRFCAGFKSGVWNVIDSLQVELDGKTILTESDYKLYWNNIRCQTDWANSDLYKHAAESFVAPDDWSSMAFSNAATTGGDGFINNYTNEQGAAGASLESLQLAKNNGFVRRVYCNPQPTSKIDGGGYNPFNWVTQRSGVSTNIAMQNGKGAFAATSTAAGPNSDAAVWYHMLKIRLIDLHPLFKELDLIANPSLKLRIRCNAGFCDIGGTGVGVGTSTMSLTSTTMTSGNTVPVMIASAAPLNAMSGVLPGSGTINLRLAFGPLQNAVTPLSTAAQFFPFTASRLMIPFYDFHPAKTQQIIAKPVKQTVFLDCYAQYFTQRAGIGTSTTQLNAPFNLQLSAFQKNIKYVVLIPFSETSSAQSGGSGTHWATAHGTEQFRSPFDTAPWSCQPGSSIRNFQVQIGNDNVFSKTIDYDFEGFMDEFKKLGSINGSLTHEISNGLINHQLYSMIHRYQVADCSRITNPDVPQSVVISGVNGACQGSNLLVLVIYERKIAFDRVTGEVQLD